MVEKRNEGLLVKTEPLELAKRSCTRTMVEARIVDGMLSLEAYPPGRG